MPYAYYAWNTNLPNLVLDQIDETCNVQTVCTMYGLCLLTFSQDKGSVVLSYHYIRHLIVSVVQLGSVGCFRAPEHMGT